MKVGRRNRIDRVRLPSDLTPVVDKQRHGVAAAQSAKILHHAALPEEGSCLSYQALKGVGVTDSIAGESHHVATRVDSVSPTLESPFKSLQIDDVAVLPNNAVERQEIEKWIDFISL